MIYQMLSSQNKDLTKPLWFDSSAQIYMSVYKAVEKEVPKLHEEL